MAEDHQLTSEDCVSIIRQHLHSAHFEILNFTEQHISDAIGQMGLHNKLQITMHTHNGIQTKTFFVKRMRPAYAIQRAMIKAQRAYEKEHFAYTTFRSWFTPEDRYRCDDYMPACYLTVPNDLLVFEDLSTEGYSANKCGTYTLDLDHLFICLDAIAKFHAGSMVHEWRQSKVLGRVYKLPEDCSQYLQEPLYRRHPEYLGNKMYGSFVTGVTALIDLVPQFEGRKHETTSKFLRHAAHVYDLVGESDKFCNVICHGDLWIYNILFKYQDDVPVQCRIIDYQALRYTVPAHDFLILVMGHGVEYERHFDTLKQYYYKCLQKCLAESGLDVNERMTYQQFLESIEYMVPFAVVQKMCFQILCIMQVDDEIVRDERCWTQFMYEDMSVRCIKAYKEHAYFKDRVDKAFKELEKLQ